MCEATRPSPPPAETVPTRCLRPVVFTHFGSLKYTEKATEFIDVGRDFFEYYKGILTSYLKCERLAHVYIFVDWAFRDIVKRVVVRGGGLHFDRAELRQEGNLKQLLAAAEGAARLALGKGPGTPPVFHYVGMAELENLLTELTTIDPSLLNLIASQGGRLTYDSPKFVEAVIRIARGNVSHLANHPILRFDEDVEPTPRGIDLLLKKYDEARRMSSYFFFSGTYGSKTAAPDPLNDHAVRLHWFTWPTVTPGGNDLMQTFLADLNELGATQIIDSKSSYSAPMKALLAGGRTESARVSPQVISGAGLIMSYLAIRLLPPFMNFSVNTVWVDDQLKRRLHEALGDLSFRDPERIADAVFIQDRYPDGVTEKDVDWAFKGYFDRLLRGCLLRRLIMELDGTPTEYSTLISDIVRYRVGGRSRRLKGPGLDRLKQTMYDQARERYEEVIQCWAWVDSSGYASHDWAKSRDSSHRDSICKEIVEDAAEYARLVQKWPIFVRAIDRLDVLTANWLFME